MRHRTNVRHTSYTLLCGMYSLVSDVVRHVDAKAGGSDMSLMCGDQMVRVVRRHPSVATAGHQVQRLAQSTPVEAEPEEVQSRQPSDAVGQLLQLVAVQEQLRQRHEA